MLIKFVQSQGPYYETWLELARKESDEKKCVAARQLVFASFQAVG